MEEGDFTKARYMLFPRNVLVGHGVIDLVPSICKDFKLCGTGLLVTGCKTRKVAGDPIRENLVRNGYDIHIIDTDEANQENLKKVEQVAKEVKATYLLGVGGGSKIDLAKMAAKDLNLEFLSIPTSASHDGIASGRASISNRLASTPLALACWRACTTSG
jgi:glycerol-1-phosphate dehydrogenase [NAD(P)+]